jgi:hypothetical protein
MRFFLPLVALIGILSGSTGFAKSSACILYVENNGAPMSVQASCDGSDLKEIFQSNSISAAISKGVPMYIDKGYLLEGCTDSHSNGPEVDAYSRCLFVKK